MKRNKISLNEYKNAINIFKSFNYPVTVEDMSIEDIIRVSKSDKKMNAGQIRFTLLNSIGNAYIDYNVTEEEMAESLKEILI